MQDDVVRILRSDMTVSDKIRALAAGGMPRAEIGRVLGKRYQHVRNVLEADKLKGAPSPVASESASGVSEAPARYGSTVRLFVLPDGAVRLPPDVLEHLQTRPGAVLIAEIQSDGVQLLSSVAAIRRAQDFVAKLNIDPSRVLSEELIAERRAEVAREEEELARDLESRDRGRLG